MRAYLNDAVRLYFQELVDWAKDDVAADIALITAAVQHSERGSERGVTADNIVAPWWGSQS